MMKKAQTPDKIALLRLAYKGLEDKELEEVAKLTRFRSYPTNHILCHEGADENVLYIVAEGNVVIAQKMSDNRERILRVGGKGDVVGEMALIQNAPRSASVRTISACTMLEMKKKDFETILSRSPRMAIDIIRITLDRIRENDQMAIEDLQKTNKVLRQLDRNKLEFIQVTAHELRTPLTILKGYVDMLHSFPEMKENPTLEGILEGIGKGANRMHEVVNTMLDVTRIDSEVLKIAFVPVSLKQVINEIVYSFSEALKKRAIKIEVEMDEKTPNIKADPGLIEKALYHLVVNAIKYTPDGGRIVIGAHPVLMGDNRDGVEISVKDTGIGLDLEHHELVFEKFYQVGSVATHSSGKTAFKGGGAGLGLAIVSGVARAHGGKVWVDSAGYNEETYPGSVFYLQIPVNSQEVGGRA